MKCFLRTIGLVLGIGLIFSACSFSGGNDDSSIRTMVLMNEIANIKASLQDKVDDSDDLNVSTGISIPIISPAPGDYSEGIKEVSISCEDNDAIIYYTTDGNAPTTTDNTYKGPFTIIGSKTVKAIAVKGKSKSSVATAKYNLNAGKTASQMGIITGKIALSENLSDAVKQQLASSDVYIYSDDMPGVVKQTKVGETYYFDGLDTSRSYSFFFSNEVPGIVQGNKSSRGASIKNQGTAKDENGMPLVAKKVEVVPAEGAGIAVDVDLSATGTIKGKAKRFDVSGEIEADNSGIVVYIPGTSYSAYTDGEGNFAMTGVPQGSHTIRAQYAGYTFVEKENCILQAVDENAPEFVIEEELHLAFGQGIVKGSVIFSDAVSANVNNGIQVVITDSSNKYTYSAVTSTGGSYSFTDIYPGVYTAELFADGYESAVIIDINVVGATVTTIPTTTLQLIGGSLSGNAAISGKADCSGISILAENTETGKSFFAITNSEGKFTFDSVSPGSYKISASYAGYSTSYVSDIIVTMGAEVKDIVIPELKESTFSIAGIVYLEGMSIGFEGTSVLVSDASNLKAVGNTVTGVDGTFTVSDVEPGTYTLTISREGYLTNNSISVYVGTSAIAVIDDVILKNALGSVTGTVTMESASDNAGIAILLTSTDSEKTYSTTTDSTGHYALSGVTPGTYRVQATHAGFNNGYTDPFTVSTGAVSTLAAIELFISLRSIYGKVILEGKTDCSGVKITATNIGNPSQIYSALSNSQGVYALSGMTPGEYILSISLEGYRSFTSGSISLEQDSSKQVDDVQLNKATGKIAGIVNLEGCTDHSGITVQLMGTDKTFVTEADGSYEFTVPSGNYPGGVRFSREDFQLSAKADTITVLTDSTYGVLTVEMKCLAVPVVGVINVAGAEDNSGVLISVDGQEAINTTSEADGSYVLKHVPLGYRTIRFAKTDVPDITTERNVEPCNSLDIGTLTMIPNAATLKGNVYLKDMTDHSGVTITVKTLGRDDIVVRTASDGSFEANNILASTEDTVVNHEIIFSKDGWTSQTINIDDLEPLEKRNLSPSITLVDEQAPVLESVIINNGANYASDTTLKVELKAAEKGSGIDKMAVQVIVTDNGVEKPIHPTALNWQSYKVGFDYNLKDLPDTVFIGNAAYTLVVTLKDKAGNVSEAGRKTINVTDFVTTLDGVLKGENLHLVKIRSPYLVVADCNVADSDTLVIDPGVEIRFDGEYCISVSGEIHAMGTADEKILFTKSDSNEGRTESEWYWNSDTDNGYIYKTYYWTGLAVNGSSMTIDANNEYVSGNILKYCEFEYANTPVTIKTGTYVYGCNFHDNGNAVNMSISTADGYTGADAVVLSNNFEQGVNIDSCYSALVTNNKIKNRLNLNNYCNVTIRNNTITDSSVYLSDYRGHCSDNIFENCNFGINRAYSFIITNNNFIDCDSPIVSTESGYQTGKSYNLAGNFWGAANTEELNLKGSDANISFISDYYDNFRYMKIDYSNWLTSANPDAGYYGMDFVPRGRLVVTSSLDDGMIYDDPKSTVTVNFGAATYSAIESYNVYVDGVVAASNSGMSSYSFSSSYNMGLPYMAAGEHKVKIEFIDKAGNISAEERSFTINKTNVSGADLAGVSWNKTTGQPMKDSRTAYLWHLDSSGAEENNSSATIYYSNAIGGLGSGCASSAETSNAIGFDTSNNAFTVEYWIKGNDKRSKPCYIVRKDDSFGAYNSVNIYYEKNDSISVNGYASALPQGDSEWHHVAKVFGGNYAATYIDGILVACEDNITIQMYNSSKKLCMFLENAVAVDEIRISNAARSADEIAAYYKDAVEVMNKTTGSLGAIVY